MHKSLISLRQTFTAIIIKSTFWMTRNFSFILTLKTWAANAYNCYSILKSCKLANKRIMCRNCVISKMKATEEENCLCLLKINMHAYVNTVSFLHSSDLSVNIMIFLFANSLKHIVMQEIIYTSNNVDNFV